MKGFASLFSKRRLWQAILVAVVWLVLVQIVFWTKSAEKSRSLQTGKVPAVEQWFANIHERRVIDYTENEDAGNYGGSEGNTSYEREMPTYRQRSTPRDVCFSISHSQGYVAKQCPFVVVVTHSLDGRLANTKGDLSVFDQQNQLSFLQLAEFLQTASEYDAATCLQPSKENVDSRSALRETNSSWCRFSRREWSMAIRNTGQWKEISKSQSDNTSALNYIFQECNVVQGPFVIRAGVFEKLGRWKGMFGKTGLLDFFLRSKGELRVAKLAKCVWSKEITKVDRGSRTGLKHLQELASFGNEHGILRIIKEDGIDWTSCIANHILCPEKPYVPPKALPEVALPICCSVVVYNLLYDFAQAADKLRIEYRLIYGTLLGAVRSNAIIPWTHDADVAIDRTAYDTPSTYPAFQKVLGDKYYIGNSFMDMPRMHSLVPPHLDLDTRRFFNGPDDLQGDAFFSPQVEGAVQGMFPISEDWRKQCYLDVYFTFDPWLNWSTDVIINNKKFATIKEINYELTNWYGKNYLEPALKDSWFGLSDKGAI